jgi:hypothetical protein
VVHDFNDILAGKLIPDVLTEIRNDIKQGKNDFYLKGIARIFLWVTIFLGRYYGIPGRGDIAQLRLLYSQQKLSDIVYQKMTRALSYLTTYRYQTHMKAKAEQDRAPFTPELVECLQTFSNVIGISRAWVKKKLTGDAGGKPPECFKTLRPDAYEYYTFNVKELLSLPVKGGSSNDNLSARKVPIGDPLRAARRNQ